MFIIIGVWGGPRRVYAAFKLFLYTLLGSVLMLIALMAMYFDAGTTSNAFFHVDYRSQFDRIIPGPVEIFENGVLIRRLRLRLRRATGRAHSRRSRSRRLA